MTVPSTSPAVVAHAANDLRVEEVPVRTPTANDAIIEIAYGGICGSDLHYWTSGAAGESILRAPMVLGHEVVGTVVHRAVDGSGPAVGVRVAVHPASPAGDGVARYPADRPNLSPALHLPRKCRPTRTPTARSSATRRCPAACCARCRTVSICAPPR